MQITSNYYQQPVKYNTSFGIRGSHNPQKLLTDKTMQVISAAISSAGIASIALQQHVDDYAQTFDAEIYKSNLHYISADAMAEAMENAPVLIDTILTDTNKQGNTRCLNDKTLKDIIDLYLENPELTVELLLAKDKNGDYKYITPQIKSLIQIHKEIPELHSTALEHPTIIKHFTEQVDNNNQPLYGVDDIKNCYKAYQKNPNFTKKLIQHRDDEGKARFSGKEIHYIVRNFDEKDEFSNYILKAKSLDNSETFRFNPKEIIELHKLAKDKTAKDFIRQLCAMKTTVSVFGRQDYLPTDLLINIAKKPETLDKYTKTRSL